MRVLRVVLLAGLVLLTGAASASATLSWRWGPKAIPTNLAAGGGFISISCPSTSLCVAGDDVGHVVATTHPFRGAGAWPSVYRDPSVDVNGSAHEGNITDIACPSSSLCVAVDTNGFVLASTNPTAGGSWKHYAIDPGFFAQSDGGQLDAVVCPPVSLAAGATTPRRRALSTSAQRPCGARRRPFLACAGPSFCIAFDNRPLSEQALVWTLSGYRGHPAWRRTTIRIRGDQDGTDLLREGACPSSSACVFMDNNGFAYLGTPGRPVRCVVPKLRNKTVAGARRALARSHCSLGRITGHHKRRVRSQHPQAGSRLPAGAAVSIVVG